MFANSRNLAITGGEFKHINYVKTAFDKLQEASAPSALYDSSARFDPPKCHPNTRVAVLEYLMGWIFGRNDPEALILWLYGPAGVGKSAILQTITERCAANNTLLASFFFGRSDPTRNQIKPLMPTIACQIAITIPELKPYVEGALERDPFLLDKFLAAQFQAFIVQPLQDLVASGNSKPGSPRLIVIDGLDECNDHKMQSMILEVIADAFRSQNLPLIFLIASLPERNIHYTFSSAPLSGLWRSVVLDDTYKPDNDIRLFLTEKFDQIKANHPHRHLMPEAWPNGSDVDKLVWKASGQFIYASLVVKYVSFLDDRPSRRLDVIMGLRPARQELPFAELDALYIHILKQCSDKLDNVLRVLELLVSGIGYTHVIEALLGLERGDVNIILAPLAAIIGPRKLSGDGIALLHSSFVDFLTDVSRSPSAFYISRQVAKEKCLSLCVLKYHDPSTITSLTPHHCVSRTLGTALYYSAGAGQTTEDISAALAKMSLVDIWNSWTSVQCPYCMPRIAHITQLFGLVSFLARVTSGEGVGDVDNPPQRVYKSFLSSFEPIFTKEMPGYFENSERTALVVLSLLDFGQLRDHSNDVKSILLQLSKETRDFDANSLYLSMPNDYDLVPNHYRHLLPLDASHFIQTTLRVLHFLCAYPPDTLGLFYRPQFGKNITTSTVLPAYPLEPEGPHLKVSKKGIFKSIKGAKNHRKSPSILKPYKSKRKQPHSDTYLRFRREKKHRRGVQLFPARPRFNPADYPNFAPRSHVDSCYMAFLSLPQLLDRCPRSEELIAYIRTHGWKIAFFPRETRYAIRVLYDYLDRVTQDVEMIDVEFEMTDV